MLQAFAKSLAPLFELRLHSLQQSLDFLRPVKAQMDYIAQIVPEAGMKRDDQRKDALQLLRHERKRKAVDVEVEVDEIKPARAGFESVSLMVVNND